MSGICIIANRSGDIKKLYWEIIEHGLTCSIISCKDEMMEQIVNQKPDLLLIEIGSINNMKGNNYWLKEINNLPIIALADRENLNIDNITQGIDDFIFSPYEIRELLLRMQKVTQYDHSTSNSQLIKSGKLTLDLARCEVFVDNKPVLLTFKEYELLKFLAANPGRVHSREALLNSVWGYEYFGGDRTVDVHIRRLRSKIEDSGHTFLETVRNIGYRFKIHR